MVSLFGLGVLAFDFDQCSCDLLFGQICFPLILLNYLKPQFFSPSHSKKEPLMPVTMLKETLGPKSITSEVRMYIIHSISSYIPVLFSLVDLTALIYFYVFESKDVQPLISMAAVSLLWGVSGMMLVALV